VHDVNLANRRELWDIITRDMESNLEEIREHASKSARLSAMHLPGHQHQKSWKKAIERQTTMEAQYEASIISREHERP
jgi:hypothetical protein